MHNNSGGIERLGVRPYDWWNEALHGIARAGKATVFPQAIGLAATFDDTAVYEMFDMVSDEGRAKYHDFQRKGMYNGYKGLTFWTRTSIFSVILVGDAAWKHMEKILFDYENGACCRKRSSGDGTQKYDKAHACAKHYAVHSGPEWNRHSYNAENISIRDLRETYLPLLRRLLQKEK